MLSLGTEFFFAFWMASKSVGLPAGSPPPVRAATSTFLMSRANSLPRLASTTAFLCLVVAHFEWPDIDPPSRRLAPPRAMLHEEPVDAEITGELGVEGGGEHVPCRTATILPAAGPSVDAAQHLDAGADRARPTAPG